MKSTAFPHRTVKILLLLVATMAAVQAGQIEGINVPPQVTVSGKSLMLNGAGVRSVGFLGIPVKVYVAAFYTLNPVRSPDAALSVQRPARFDFTFLRTVGQSDVTKAWNSQFAASVSYSYPGLPADQARFAGFFGPLNTGDTETVVLLDKTTEVYDKGALKGSIAGKDFQKAFLSMWFGSKPVGDSLMNELLGK